MDDGNPRIYLQSGRRRECSKTPEARVTSDPLMTVASDSKTEPPHTDPAPHLLCGHAVL